MTENTKIPAAQNSNDNRVRGIGPNAENTKNPEESSDWLGGPQNGDETTGESYQEGEGNNSPPSGVHYTKHRFDATTGESTEGAYQQNGQSWLGGPQNGDETTGNGGNALIDDLDGTSSNDERVNGRGER